MSHIDLELMKQPALYDEGQAKVKSLVLARDDCGADPGLFSFPQ
jgi:hypothetical protein